MNKAVLFSSASPEWCTPIALFNQLNKEYGPFNLDPCATDETALCSNYFTEHTNGLAQKWFGRVFMNPPYGRSIKQWVKKAYEEAETNCEIVVCLLPARVCTSWFHDYCLKGEVKFLRGRLRFSDSSENAPFPSMLVIFRGNKNGK